MVVEIHAMHQPAKTERTVCVVEEPPQKTTRTVKMIAHTIKQPMEYAQ
jgi:hypothetical protein